MKIIRTFALLGALSVGISAHANASTIWTLSSVTFGPCPGTACHTAVGSFIADSTFTTVLSYDITVSSPVTDGFDFHYKSGDGHSVASIFATNVIFAGEPGFNPTLNLAYAGLTNSGGTVPLIIGTGASNATTTLIVNNGPALLLNGPAGTGTLNGAPVPEPGTLTLAGLGLAAVVALKRRMSR